MAPSLELLSGQYCSHLVWKVIHCGAFIIHALIELMFSIKTIPRPFPPPPTPKKKKCWDGRKHYVTSRLRSEISNPWPLWVLVECVTIFFHSWARVPSPFRHEWTQKNDCLFIYRLFPSQGWKKSQKGKLAPLYKQTSKFSMTKTSVVIKFQVIDHFLATSPRTNRIGTNQNLAQLK